MIARTIGAGIAAVLLPATAGAQSMLGMDMGAHVHHATPAPKPAASRPAPARKTPRPAAKPPAADHRTMDHGAASPPPTEATMPMDHDAMPGMDMAHDHAAMPADTAQVAPPAGTDLPAGNGPAPAPPRDHYADRIWGAGPMAAARAMMHGEHGGGTFSKVMLNLAEIQLRKGRNAYRWDGEAWFGGDINRLTIKSEGEGGFGGRTESADVQALYSRAIDPYWNLQAGLRQDIRPGPARTYAALGVEGLAPYWFEVTAALFLSDKGDLIGRVEAYHDMRLTQRLILQPRAELNLAAQDVPARGIGSGLSDAELGLRLRYEVKRQFAPYVGISWQRKTGHSARFARLAGDDVASTGLTIGIRTWF